MPTAAAPGLVGVGDVVAAHAGGEVEDHVHARGAHALDHLAVELQAARGLAGLRVADMDMGDRGPGLGRLDRGAGDLLRRYRYRRMLADRVARPGHGAGDHNLGVHRRHPSCNRSIVARRCLRC